MPPFATAGHSLLEDIALLRLTSAGDPSIAEPRPTFVDRQAGLSIWSPSYQIGYGRDRDRQWLIGANYRDWLQPDDRVVKVDTTRNRAELSETNNARSAVLDIPDCSFN